MALINSSIVFSPIVVVGGQQSQDQNRLKQQLQLAMLLLVGVLLL